MDLPKILEKGKTPAQWVEIFADQGVDISERTLREKARSLNAYCALGKAMLIKTEHIDRIFEEMSCHSKSTNEETGSGSVAELTESTVTLNEASKHLMDKLRRPKSVKSRGRHGNVLCLDKTRRQKQTS